MNINGVVYGRRELLTALDLYETLRQNADAKLGGVSAPVPLLQTDDAQFLHLLAAAAGKFVPDITPFLNH